MTSAPKKNPKQDEVVILTDPAAMLAARFDQPSVTSAQMKAQRLAVLEADRGFRASQSKLVGSNHGRKLPAEAS